MKCPFCAEDNTKVIDSRPADDNSSIRRRRQCERCGKRFTTYEKLETIPLVVIKKDLAREPYNRDKIEQGIFRSCTKLAISIDEINQAVDQIETEIFNLGEKEVSSKYIGEVVMERLKALNPVAYVRFASIYREFTENSRMLIHLWMKLKKYWTISKMTCYTLHRQFLLLEGKENYLCIVKYTVQG